MTTTHEPTQAERIEMEIRREHTMPDGGEMLISRIFEISAKLPKNINELDPSYARHISGVMLEGVSMCGDLYSYAVSYELKMEAKKKAAFSKAMMVRAAEAGIKSAKDREQFAYSDTEYLAAQTKSIEAKFFKTMVEEKKQLFLKAHHLMKDVVSNDTDIGEKRNMPNEEWGTRLLPNT